MQEDSKITTQDLKEFLQMFLRQSDYERLQCALRSKKEFRFVFKLIQKISEVQHVIICNRNQHFNVRFIPDCLVPEQIALSSRFAESLDDMPPDVIVFIE